MSLNLTLTSTSTQLLLPTKDSRQNAAEQVNLRREDEKKQVVPDTGQKPTATTVCIYKNDFLEAIREGKFLRINYLQPQTILIDMEKKEDVDSEIIRMLKIRSQKPKPGPYASQEVVGKIMNLSRQMISRRWHLYKDKGLQGLLKDKDERENSQITPQVLKRLPQLIVMNPFLSGNDLKKILEKEGLSDGISISTIYNAQQQMDGKEIVQLLREKGDRSDPDVFMSSNYIFEKLSEIIDSLIEQLPWEHFQKVAQPLHLYDLLKSHIRKTIQSCTNRNRNRDLVQQRKKLQRDKKRNQNLIKRFIYGDGASSLDADADADADVDVDMDMDMAMAMCPDCLEQQGKFHFSRERHYRDETGEKITGFSTVYHCLNPSCATKYFTIPPKGVELYARVHKKVKQSVLRWTFNLRSTLSRVRDELLENGINVSLTTVLRWIKKAGEECPEQLKIVPREFWQQPLIIDEKWIKIRDQWNYIFTAVGDIVSDLLAVDVFAKKDKQAMKTFLLSLKAKGFRPRVIVTDLLMGYENLVKEVFPNAEYHQCVLHAERDAKRLVRKHLPEGIGYDNLRETLIKRIRKLFASKRTKQINKRYIAILKLKPNAPHQLNGLFDMLNKYIPKLSKATARKDIPRTTNAVERAIGEFEEKYCLTKGFTSFYYARCFVKIFQVYYRLRKISFGRFKGKSRLQLKGNPLAKLKFTEYLVQTYQ